MNGGKQIERSKVTVGVGHICLYIDYISGQGKTYEQLCDELSEEDKKFVDGKLKLLYDDTPFDQRAISRKILEET